MADMPIITQARISFYFGDQTAPKCHPYGKRLAGIFYIFKKLEVF